MIAKVTASIETGRGIFILIITRPFLSGHLSPA
jgi:hypothetical protein